MDLKALINDNIGKRMAAMAWGVWNIGQSEDLKKSVLIAALVAIYMVLQTISDYIGRSKQ